MYAYSQILCMIAAFRNSAFWPDWVWARKKKTISWESDIKKKHLFGLITKFGTSNLDPVTIFKNSYFLSLILYNQANVQSMPKSSDLGKLQPKLKNGLISGSKIGPFVLFFNPLVEKHLNLPVCLLNKTNLIQKKWET